MKKVLVSLLSIIIIALTLATSASGTTTSIYTIDSTTIEFSEDSSLTAEEKATIAELVAHGSDVSSATTYNVMCNLFGHKTTTESFTVIKHCVSATAPRCLKSLQDVTTCSRCDYVSTDVISSYYIFCCD